MPKSPLLWNRLFICKKVEAPKVTLGILFWISAVVDTTFVDIYVDTKNIPTSRYNIQHIDKRTMENKMSIIMWEAAMSYATTFK